MRKVEVEALNPARGNKNKKSRAGNGGGPPRSDRPILPTRGASAQAAYQFISEILKLDAEPVANVASSVNAWMEPEGDRLAVENLQKNLVDQVQYPQLNELSRRVLQMTAELLSHPAPRECEGTTTTGSSEAMMLALCAHRKRWEKLHPEKVAAGVRPNVVYGADAHTCWKKFPPFFGVEGREVPLTRNRLILTPEAAAKYIDEDTFAVGCVVGSTYTGQRDDVAGIHELLEELHRNKGWDIPIHVDAAAAFIAPFVYPEVKWDFRLSRVRSFNVSNHKYGYVYPGMGTVVFRGPEDVPDELIFNVDYLGEVFPNFSLSFSRPGAPVAMQYYNFLRYGWEGYAAIARKMMGIATYLREQISEFEPFESLDGEVALPVAVLRYRDDAGLPSLGELIERLKRKRWCVPHYHLPPEADTVEVTRFVVRQTLNRDLVDKLLDDIAQALR